MALARNIMRGGYSAGQAKAVNGAIATGLTAAGTVISDALDLTADTNVIGTCASGAGVQVFVAELGDCCFRPLQNLRVFSGGLARLGKKTRKVVAMERHDQTSSVVGRQYYAAPVVLCKALQNSRY